MICKSTVIELMEIINKIRESNKIVIVEGREDKIALKKLGISNIIQLNKNPMYVVVEECISRGEDVIILTDLDKKGKELYGKLNHDLQRFGVKVDNRLREFLFRNTKLRQIEGLSNYIDRRLKFNAI